MNNVLDVALWLAANRSRTVYTQSPDLYHRHSCASGSNHALCLITTNTGSRRPIQPSRQGDPEPERCRPIHLSDITVHIYTDVSARDRRLPSAYRGKRPRARCRGAGLMGIDQRVLDIGNCAQFWELSDEQWQTMIDVNKTGVWRTLKAAVSTMPASDDEGSIIATSSVAELK
jgi:hypothetical protein